LKRYSTNQAPKLLGKAGWNALLELPSDPRVLEDNVIADFVVVGAGYTGLSAALRLKQIVPDAKVVVLEAGRLAEGSAGCNSGFMADLPHILSGAGKVVSRGDVQLVALNRHAQEFAGAAVQKYDINPHFFDRAGSICGAADLRTEAIVRQEAVHLSKTGDPFEALDAKVMYETTGSHYYYSGLYTPGTVMLQPAGYIRGLAAGLRRDGIAIYENSTVSGIERDGSGWSIVTPKGRISAGKLILAVNEHLENFGLVKSRLVQMFLFGAITEELSADAVSSLGGDERWSVSPADPMGTTVRRIDTGQGGNRLFLQTSAALRSDLASRKSDLARADTLIRKKFEDRFPRLTNLKLEHCWASHLCLSGNGSAVMQELDEGLFAACAQNESNAAGGTLIGIGAAELACGERSAVTDHFENEPQPKRFASAPLHYVSGNVALRWKEWRARRA